METSPVTDRRQVEEEEEVGRIGRGSIPREEGEGRGEEGRDARDADVQKCSRAWPNLAWKKGYPEESRS